MEPALHFDEQPASDPAGDLRSAILDAALEEIGDRELDDLLKCLTPGGLAQQRAFSSSAVRYHFGRESTRFDRETLATALVDRLGARLREQARSAAAGYAEAIETVRAGGDIAAVEAALAQDLESFTPGSSGAQATASDRLYLLAVAMCDSSRQLTAQLRSMREDILTSYDRVYESCLELTGRTMSQGVTTRDLTIAVNAFLEGLMVLRRQHAEMSLSSTADVVLRMFFAFTVEEGVPDVTSGAALVASHLR